MRAHFITILLAASLGQISYGSAAFSSPIEIKGGFIVLSAEINGIPGQYILDTGAPGLVMNSQYQPAGNATYTDLAAVNGTVENTLIGNWTFEWNLLRMAGTEAYAIDLTYLEHRVKERVDGLIGLDMFNGYYVLIDYSRQSLELWDRVPERMSEYPSVSLALEFQDHVPMVVFNHGDRVLRFAMDSGSGSHLLDKTVSESLQASVNILDLIDLVGADQQVVRTTKVELTGLSTGGFALPGTPFVLADLSHLQHDEGTPIDGVFGQPIFEDRVILIDRCFVGG
jgi:hypothetical protein